MPTYTEEWVVSQWIYETLNVSSITTLAVGGVHRGFVPPATETLPYVAYDPATSTDLYAMNSQPLVETEMVWDIQVIGEGGQQEAANKVAALIFGLLNGQSATVSSGKINHCRRVYGPLTRPSFEEKPIFYCVSSYNIGAKAT